MKGSHTDNGWHQIHHSHDAQWKWVKNKKVNKLPENVYMAASWASEKWSNFLVGGLIQ